MENRISRIYIFDDCDANVFETWDNFEEVMQDAMGLLIQLLGSEEDHGRLLDKKGCRLNAFLGDYSYSVFLDESNSISKADPVQCAWLTDQGCFDQQMDALFENVKGHNTLFLVDWTMGNLKWADVDKRTGVQILDKLFSQFEEGNNLSGVLVCYTSVIQEAPFRYAYPEQERRFSVTSLKPMKMQWRWNDIESTEYTLYRKLTRLLQNTKGVERT